MRSTSTVGALIVRVVLRVAGFVRRHPEALLVALALTAYGVWSHFFGNRIIENEGLGFDGVHYARISRSFPEMLEDQRFNIYYVKRILPSTVVHYLLLLRGRPLATPFIITGFEMVNLALLVGGTFVWSFTARLLGLSRVGLWIGFVALLGNAQVLKLGFFYPTLTDTWIYMVGLLLVYAYLADRPILLFSTSLVGGFVQQTLPLMGFLLFVFPRSRSLEGDSDRPSRLPRSVLGLLLVGAYLLIGVWTGELGNALQGRAAVLVPILILGLIGALVYLFRGLLPLLEGGVFVWPGRLARSISVGRVVVAVGGAAALWIAYRLLTVNGSQDAVVTLDSYAASWFHYSVLNFWNGVHPFSFIVGHFAFFGPTFGLLLLCWRRVSRTIIRFGVAPSIVAALAVVLSLHSESRQFLALYPLFAVALVAALDESEIRARFVVALSVLSVVFSKAWITIPALGDDYSVWPAQAYFMHHGPWMSTPAYLIHAAAIAVTMGAMAWALEAFRFRETSDNGRTA